MTPGGEAVKRRILHALGQDVGNIAAEALVGRTRALLDGAALSPVNPPLAPAAEDFARALESLAADDRSA